MFNEDFSKNVVIVDKNGNVIYFTENNMPIYDFRYDEIIGNNITKVYKNLNYDNSSLIKAIHSGSGITNLKQGLETRNNKIINQVGNTYPLIENNEIIGAIEFSEIINHKLIKSRYYKEFSINNMLSNGTKYELEDIITIDEGMKKIKEKIRRISKTNSNILIYGETGTGKELVAQSLHNESNRRNNQFVSQNCGAIPETLVESTLFGTEEGSFTGAKSSPGLFELAQGGTLFLDEINSLPFNSQAKLLKAIEDKRIRRVGGTKEIDIDIRIISATNKPIKDLLDDGILRNDLYYRLAVVQIILPPLRNRKTDIEYLSNYFIEKFNREFKFSISSLDKDMIEIFKEYSWPGNIRELKNVIESSFNLAEEDYISCKDLPENILEYKDRNKDIGLKGYLENEEKRIILNALKNNENKLTAAADDLKISKQLLRYKLDKYDK